MPPSLRRRRRPRQSRTKHQSEVRIFTFLGLGNRKDRIRGTNPVEPVRVSQSVIDPFRRRCAAGGFATLRPRLQGRKRPINRPRNRLEAPLRCACDPDPSRTGFGRFANGALTGLRDSPPQATANRRAPGCDRRGQSWLPPCPAPAALRLRVAAAFLAAADLFAGDRAADAAPPIRPPLCAAGWPVDLPRPDPPARFPPPSSLLTVAQARRSASFSGTPRLS